MDDRIHLKHKHKEKYTNYKSKRIHVSNTFN